MRLSIRLPLRPGRRPARRSRTSSCCPESGISSTGTCRSCATRCYARSGAAERPQPLRLRKRGLVDELLERLQCGNTPLLAPWLGFEKHLFAVERIDALARLG